jgi:hypothetical protein
VIQAAGEDGVELDNASLDTLARHERGLLQRYQPGYTVMPPVRISKSCTLRET